MEKRFWEKGSENLSMNDIDKLRRREREKERKREREKDRKKEITETIFCAPLVFGLF